MRKRMGSIWVTDKEWAAETCAVLGSGPGMTREVAEVVRASGCRTISVNAQAIPINGHAAMAPWSDILYAADHLWWAHNRQVIFTNFKGRKVSIMSNSGVWPNLPDGVLVLGNGGPKGVDDRAGYVRTGHNSGFQAVGLAHSLGAKRIVLCGFDMHAKQGEHWFGDYKWRKGYTSRYDIFIRAFVEAAPEYRKRNIEIINATPGSALKAFPIMGIEEALNGLRGMREDEGNDAATGSETLGRDRAQPSASEVTATAADRG